MKRRVAAFIGIAVMVSILAPGVIERLNGDRPGSGFGSDAVAASHDPVRAVRVFDDGLPWSYVDARHQADLIAMAAFRPGYAFRQNIFSLPDGYVALARVGDGQPLAVVPASWDWTTGVTWNDPALKKLFAGVPLPRSAQARRDEFVRRLEAAVGPVMYNTTRGGFLAPNVARYGGFLGEWGAIYERFGVPAEIGLAQALIESGFNGTRRSEADAVGLCQWLDGNWKRLDRLAPDVIEAHNQTTQAAYCAAYLSVLATKYDSFIPALSEHHAGGTNVGRIVIAGERLEGADPREQYFLGADFARDLRQIGHPQYSGLYQSYGPRSYLYAEMAFGNIPTLRASIAGSRQVEIHAMRTTRAVPLSEITRRTGLSADEVRRFNPALVRQVPAGGTLYLPAHDPAFGADVTFWHRPAPEAYVAVLNDFVRLDAPPAAWDEPAFEAVLREFERRFRATKTEEGSIMATVLAYVRDESSRTVRHGILADYRTNPGLQALFDRGVREREAAYGGVLRRAHELQAPPHGSMDELAATRDEAPAEAAS